MQVTKWISCLCGAALLPWSASAITLGAFGPHGEGGSKNAQAWTIGPGGTVYELDAFVSLDGFDLNGSLPGTAAALSRDSLPAGLGYCFASSLAADTSDVTLAYTFSNVTTTVFSNLRFAVLLDAEIDQAANTFFNEYGVTSGTLGTGPSDQAPDQWQIDEPGFLGGTLLRNLYLASLSNSNSIPRTAPNDVALGLGFNLGTLWPGMQVTVRVMISESNHTLGSFALEHHDAAPGSTTVITLSGQVDPRSAVSGFVFKDANRNGRYDAGEGLAGVSLFADLDNNGVRSPTEPQSVTGPDGSYRLANLNAGTLTVRVDTSTLPLWLAASFDPDGVCDNATVLTLGVGAAQTNLNWGYQNLPSVAGAIFKDANKNNLFDAGEGLAGVIVFADLDNNGLRSPGEPLAASAANGSYTLTNLTASTLTLRVDTNTVPAGITNSIDPDGVLDNRTVITLSVGQTVTNLIWGYRDIIPPAVFTNTTPLVQFGFTWRLSTPAGSLLGTLHLTNPPASGANLRVPLQLGLPASTNYYLVHPVGSLPSGLPYVDLSAAFTAQLGSGGQLTPGAVITLDGVEVYSRDRSAPAKSWFELWATRAQ